MKKTYNHYAPFFVLVYGLLQNSLCIAMTNEDSFCKIIIPNHYIYLDDFTIIRSLNLVSKAVNQALSETNEAVISNPDKKIYGWVEKICSKHLTAQCSCTNPHQYPGILYRKARGNTCSMYIVSPYIKKLATLYEQISEYPEIVHTKCESFIPQNTLPSTVTERQDYTTKAHISHPTVTPPYFSNNEKTEICILDSIPNIAMHKNMVRYHAINEFACSYECVLSDTTCIRRKAYFELAEKKYPFGFLRLMPLLYKKYLQQIRTSACETRIDNDTKIFCSTDFFKEHLSEDGTEAVLEKMFTIMNVRSQTKPEVTNFTERFYQDLFRKTTTENLIPFALCAKLGGNRKLARALVALYDVHSRIELQGTSQSNCRPIYLRPFGGIDGPTSGWGGLGNVKEATGSHYKSFINKISTLKSIPPALREIENNNKRLLLLRPSLCIEIRPNNGTPLLHAWQYEETFYDCHFGMDWTRGKKFILNNCPIQTILPVVDDKKSNKKEIIAHITDNRQIRIDLSTKEITEIQNDEKINEVATLPITPKKPTSSSLWMPHIIRQYMFNPLNHGMSSIINTLCARLQQWSAVKKYIFWKA